MPSEASSSNDEVVRLSREVVTEKVGGEIVVLVPSTSMFFSVSGTAKVVWEELAQSGSVRRAVAQLIERFRVSEAQATSDVQRFLGELHGAGLIEDRADDV
jgi:hypothetical protein